MANTNITLEQLKKEAVRVHSGMIAVFPQFSREETLDTSQITSKFNGAFSTNNSTTCFVDRDGAFVIPCTRKVRNALLSAGFKEDSFYVPFSNWDYPAAEQEKWNSLLEKARKSHEEEFVEDCITYSEEHHIDSINDEVLQNCFEMPSTGVRVKRLNFENCYYPILNSGFFDCLAADNIGHFCTNNGRVVFVYRDGKTYVAKGYKILSKLREAGYTESNLFVPFSNGEEILDFGLKERWESIVKQS